MDWRRLTGLLLGALVALPTAHAQEREPRQQELTLQQALALARRDAPELAVARARITEARGRREAVGVWPHNPEIQASAGPRFGAARTDLDWSVGLSQSLDFGARRGHLRAAAAAAVEASEARLDDARRLLLREVGLSFVQCLYWQRRVVLSHQNMQLAEETLRVAERRREIGDGGGLDASLASLAFSRASSEEARTEVALERSRRRLGTLLGLDSEITPIAQGDLRRLGAARRPRSRLTGDSRPDLQILTAERREALAEQQAGVVGWLPELTVGASYAREEGSHLVQGSLGLTLPVFDHGQGMASIAVARRLGAEADLEAARRRARSETEEAGAILEHLSRAARRFEEQGLPTLERTEAVAAASLRAGAIPLIELLAVRRELLAARLEYLDLLLGAAVARIEAEAAQGSLR